MRLPWSRPAPMTAEQADRIVEALDRLAAGQHVDGKRTDLLLEQLGLLTAGVGDLRRAVDKAGEVGSVIFEGLERLDRNVRELGDRMARSGRP